MAKVYFYYDKNPLQWLFSSKLNVVLNHEDSFVIKSKAVTVKEIQPGNARVQFSIPYFGSEVGIAKDDFEVNADDVVHVTYRPPFFVFSSGTIFIEKGETRSKKATDVFGPYFKMSLYFLVIAIFLGSIFTFIGSSIFSNYFNFIKPGSNVDETPQDEYTVNQRNAIRKAETYLSVMPFSRSGLIAQLKYEGFETADATFGVDNVGANWVVQAELKAAQYLNLMAFSRSGLITQLKTEGFTELEATTGVDNIEVDWFIQAELKAAQYLKIMPFSKSGLVAQLVAEGFTEEEAEHGVDSTGLK